MNTGTHGYPYVHTHSLCRRKPNKNTQRCAYETFTLTQVMRISYCRKWMQLLLTFKTDLCVFSVQGTKPCWVLLRETTCNTSK